MMHKLVFLLGALFLSMSCDSNRQYDVYKSLDNQNWHKDSIVSFKFEAKDSLSKNNIFLNLRNTGVYEFSNLFIITELQYPNGSLEVDTLEYEMADLNGNWLGTGYTDLKESKLFYKEEFVFSDLGVYEFRIQQAMRKRDNVQGIQKLKGISDVGLRIEKIK